MNARWLIPALWPGLALAQGFAGLGTDSEGYATPTPDSEFTFPADHGAHPGFRIEWWYVTATLEAADGTPMGAQWTLFRTAMAPGGAAEAQVWMGHAAVTTPDEHYVSERLSRGGLGTAGVETEPFDAWIDEWRMWGPSFDDLRLAASAPDFAYDLSLEAQGPLIFHGEDGYSVKSSEGQASYYYSQPAYAVEGTVTLPEGRVEVTGEAWLDREWSSQPLSENQEGWDWFSLSLGEAKVMGFRLRGTEGGSYTSATWIEDGATAYPDGAFTAEPLATATVAEREIPVRWRVTLPDRGLDVEVEALNPQAWMSTSFPYWEGPVSVTGSHEGRGYLEMTGYE
ncbi:lipocalin-like domain-containing protein [Histidinibacterium aquaticum]|uniref:Iron ABC transporter permease n=1 Tax=Histidinibacterium aquaticum TaxID=2613962 RepID=A0A5J5GG61_9RHOB|nr:lipocalin-like domain-containing protein [Histidinibacterium aquaticum]KAA9007000.1 iron ABC transporter permease [Histidinibacterium aquaticum]